MVRLPFEKKKKFVPPSLMAIEPNTATNGVLRVSCLLMNKSTCGTLRYHFEKPLK